MSESRFVNGYIYRIKEKRLVEGTSRFYAQSLGLASEYWDDISNAFETIAAAEKRCDEHAAEQAAAASAKYHSYTPKATS